MVKFNREKEEMNDNMKRLQDLLKSKENQMHQSEMDN